MKRLFARLAGWLGVKTQYHISWVTTDGGWAKAGHAIVTCRPWFEWYDNDLEQIARGIADQHGYTSIPIILSITKV